MSVGKLYRDPYHPNDGYIAIVDPAPGLAEPPAPDEGAVIEVDMTYSNNTARPEAYVRCRDCRTSVRRRDEHVRAVVILEAMIAPVHKRVHFCSRACWLAWASRSG